MKRSPEEQERLRRQRICHGWAFRNLTDEEKVAFRQYLDLAADTPPPGYERLHEEMP